MDIRFWLTAVVCLLLAPTARAASSSFQGVDGNWHLGTFSIGNIDADPELEIIVPARNNLGLWVLHAYNHDGSAIPGFPYLGGALEINTSPTLYDIDNDGRSEIIFTSGNQVVVLNGTGLLRWVQTVSSANYIPNAGYQAITNGFYWSLTGLLQPTLPVTAVFSSQVSPPMVADVENDGSREILTAWKIDPDPDSTTSHQDYNPFINDVYGFDEWGTVGEDWSGGVVFHDLNAGNQEFVYHIHQLVESGLAIGQADSDLPLEVYVLNDSDSVVCFDKTKPHGFHGNGMLHKNFGKNQRLLSGSYQTGVDIYAADIDGDGLDELLVPSTQFNPLWQPQETILDDDGSILWREWKEATNFSHVHGWFNSACMIPVNPDHDNRIDVLSFTHSHQIWFREWNGIELVDRPGWPKDFAPFVPTPPLVADMDGDGDEEIIIATYNPGNSSSHGTIYIFDLDGSTQWSQPVPGGVKHIPSLADIDADGNIDLVYRSLNGRFYVESFGGAASGISWSTHRGNPQHNGRSGQSLYPVGTPMVVRKESGFQTARFEWKPAPSATAYRIWRAAESTGPFLQIATVTSGTTNFLDTRLESGRQYFYEVGALYSTNEVRSAPIAILSLLNSNLVVNSGFEEDDDSHWDKWFTGDIPWTRMTGTSNEVYQGNRSMLITLQNDGNSASINQYNQYGTPDSYLPVSPGTLYSFGGYIKTDSLTQTSRQWLEWTSTKTGEDTNIRPLFPWPNYFTPHVVTGTNTSRWIYANRVFIMPNGFPNVELRHRFTVPSPASGSVYLDNVFFRRLAGPNSGQWTSLIPFGSRWRYLAATPAPNWYSEGFNDLAWLQGFAKFGAGSGPTNLTTVLPSHLSAYYFRQSFSVNSTNLSELLLAATATDDYGGVIYPMELFINGTPIMTSGIETVSGEGNLPLYYDLTLFAHLLRKGTNTIAVKLNNTWHPDWDNVAFDLNLKAVIAPAPGLARFKSITKNPFDTLLEIEAPADTLWRVNSASNVRDPIWELVAPVTIGPSGTATITDTGQNGRLHPNLVPQRIYRLAPL